jgi:predicted  nucleic acid-binding Zn-ribbon protein
MDISTLVNLKPESPAFHTFAVDLKAKITSANQQVDSLVSQITTFKTDVENGGAKMTEAYNGILAHVDADLATEISNLQVTIDSLNADVRAAQKKIKVEQSAQDAAITAIAVGSLTAWIGIGTVALAAGIAGLALTKKEIASLNATIAADKLKIKTSFNALSTDNAAKALVVLFQNAVVKSLEAHDKAIKELGQFSSLLATLEAHVNEALQETIKGTTPQEPDWLEALHQAFLEWQATNKIASALKEIKIAVKPMDS